MPFESGSLSFRLYQLPRAFPKDAVDKFAKHAAPPLDSLSAGEVRGWVTGRHLLDSHITEETAFHGGYLRLVLRMAERKIPQTLLRAECRMEELAMMAADGKPFLRANERAEIRKNVSERLLPNMPPQLKAIPFIYKPGEHHLYACALPEKMSDAFNASLVAALGFGGVPASPEELGRSLKKVDLRDCTGASFSPEIEDDAMEAAPGREFLTWLWYRAETQEKTFSLPDGQPLQVLIEGPLTFMHEGNGAHVSVLKRGEPVNSAEAKTCLLSGKKLKEAKISFAQGDWVWKFSLEADQFLFRGLMLPKSEEALDAISRFQERMQFLDQFRELFLAVFEGFLELRVDAARWRRAKDEIRAWVKSRKGRM